MNQIAHTQARIVTVTPPVVDSILAVLSHGPIAGAVTVFVLLG
jgi:hypothetical protein